ncbi:phage portal protein [Romboutsia lituseburensis]|uniref:phage portal protein n=1 Tax=Romboutsia lituseburensis TaxID=1537 RepID=UPI0022EB85FF|nr:phage portal protein [Romboutsia lituseburensis]
MDIEFIRKLIQNNTKTHNDFIKKAKVAERYYNNKNDITNDRSPSNSGCSNGDNPLRNADNRIPFNWHSFLVNQKISYMFTYPPTFDVYDDTINEKITDILGDAYPKEAKTLGRNASNCSKAWLHVWLDKNKEFQYSNVDPKQIIPIYASDLKKTLKAVLRTYSSIDEKGNDCKVYEYWDDKNCYAFKHDITKDISTGLNMYNMFTKTNMDTQDKEYISIIDHDFGEVPFVEFSNNDLGISDLDNVKQLIDVYDKVFSGFVNDIEDIQEIIFVLNNYGGTDLNEFLKGLKKYKTVDMQNDDEKSGLSTITIDIPVEARNTLLSMTEKQIYVQGQGVNPNPENFANTSGVALKFLYTLLELKSGLMETEFRLGFAKLVKMICRHLGYKPRKINQTWTRNMITNDIETAEIAKMSVGIMSNKTVRKNSPIMEDETYEEEQIKKEKEEGKNEYNNLIPGPGGGPLEK